MLMLMHQKPILDRLAVAVPWENFRPLLESVFGERREEFSGKKTN